MRIALGQLAPVPGDLPGNLARLEAAVRAARADLAVFPELFLSGYRLGDRFHALALRDDDPAHGTLGRIAREARTILVVGAPVASPERPGEVQNAALAVPPSGPAAVQVKRYLPNFGPFEEAIPFTPTGTSRPVRVGGRSLGLEICYDAFFPEVSRDLALQGAELLVNLSASPVTSRRLFERLLPARAIENACPVVYVNRVGVEDGIVFGGGSGVWDARGEPVPPTPVPLEALAPEESVATVEVDLDAAARWRPFRPVLRDVATRTPAAPPAPR
jgi:predicted amidohydrolase